MGRDADDVPTRPVWLKVCITIRASDEGHPRRSLTSEVALEHLDETRMSS